MNQGSAFTCTSCSSIITADDLAQGLAVRVDGLAVCAMCVDLLPGRAQLEINKLRAMKGLTATTYRVPTPAYPHLQRFTFTSAGNVLIHYRTLKSTGDFHAPPLPGLGPVVTAEQPRPATIAVAPRAASRGPWLVIGGLVAAVVALGALWAFIPKPVAGSHAAAPAPAPPPRRESYPADTYAAYLSASADPDCPTELLEQLRTQLRSESSDSLGQAEAALEQRKLETANDLLAAVHIPADEAFTDLRSKRRALLQALTDLRTPAPAPTPAAGTAHDAGDVIAQPAAADPGAATTTATPSTAVAVNPSPPPADPAAPQPTATPAAVPSPPAPPPTPPVAASTPAPPTSPCWFIPVSDFLPGAGNESWSLEGRLLGSSGTLSRTLPAMPAGSYQLWVYGSTRAATGSLSVLVDGTAIGTLPASACHESLFLHLASNVQLSSGVHQFALTVDGTAWRISAVYLAGADQPPPGQAKMVPVPWSDKPAATTASPAATVGRVALWNHTFVFPQHAAPVPLDGSVAIASPWPAGASPFVRAERFGRSDAPFTLELGLERAAVDQGGLVVVLHRGSAVRSSLNLALAWATPAQGQLADDEHVHIQEGSSLIELPPLALADTDRWQVLAIPLPDLGKAPDRFWLVMQDPPGASADGRGFLLGTVATVTGRTPVATDLPLADSPLSASDVVLDVLYRGQLTNLLDEVTAHRRFHPHWYEKQGFNPAAVCMLIPNPTAARVAVLTRALVTLGGAKNSNKKMILPLSLKDGWLDEVQLRADQPLIDTNEFSICLIATDAEEAVSTLSDPQRLNNWLRATLKPLIYQPRRGGLLPVMVIGALEGPIDALRQKAINKAWSKRDEALGDIATSPLPVIDLRPAQGCQDVDGAAQALLIEGLRTLTYQIDWTQATAHRGP